MFFEGAPKGAFARVRGLAEVGSNRLGVNRIQGTACRHEQAVSAGAAEANVAAYLREHDFSDALAFWREDMDPVVSFTYPAGSAPEVAVLIAADSVCEPGNGLAV